MQKYWFEISGSELGECVEYRYKVVDNSNKLLCRCSTEEEAATIAHQKDGKIIDLLVEYEKWLNT